MKKELNWYQKPLRIVDFIPPDPERYAQLDVKAAYEVRRGRGFNAEHFETCDVAMGDSGTAFFPNPAALHQQRDLLGEALKERGELRTVAYFNTHWLGEALQASHPEWMQRGADGEVLENSYGAGGYACINSPYRAYALGSVQALGKLAIDGIFLDGPFVFETGCYCEDCRRKFRERFGYEPPRTPRLGTREGEDWFLFKRESIAAFMREARETLKKENPAAVIYMNSPQLTSNLLCSRDNRMTEPYQDLLLGEGGFLYDDLRRTPIWKSAATAMLLEGQSGGKPYIVAIAGRHGPWSRYLLADEEVRLAHFFAVAHGASTWYGVYNDQSRAPAVEAVGKLNAFLEKNEAYFTGTHSTAKIALLWSYATANHFRASSEMTDFTRENASEEAGTKGDTKAALDGWIDALSRGGRMFDIIDDTALVNGQLDGYELLILPGAACLSREAAERVRAFAAGGGNLIATYDSGLYDEWGRPYEAPPLAEALGAARVVRLRKNTCGDHFCPPLGDPLFTGIHQEVLPAAQLGVECEAAGAECVGFHRLPQRARYCELPGATERPYILQSRYGKGTSLYFTGNVDAFYSAYQLPEYRRLLQNAAALLSPPELTLRAEAGVDSVHASLRAADDFAILHLVNYTASGTRPITAVLPLRDVEVTIHGWFKTHGETPRVRLLAADTKENTRREGDDLYFTLPVLNDYEAAVLPFGG